MNRRKVLHLSKTAVAGAAGLASRVIDKYSHWESDVYVEKKIMTVGDFSCDYENLVLSEDLQTYIDNADIIHFHNWGPEDFPQLKFENKKFIIQLHSEPQAKQILYKNHYKDCVTLAQKHTLLYKTLPALPNLIPLYEEVYTPSFNLDNIVRVVYSPTSKVSFPNYVNTCAGKGYNETIKILDRIKSIFKDRIEINILSGIPKCEVLAIKRKADIVIDECVTGGYHLSSLEALSMGCVTIANLKQDMLEVISQLTSSPIKEIPWVNCSIPSLEIAIIEYINLRLFHKERFLDLRRKIREWMEKYWSPSIMAKKFTDLYEEKLGIKDDPWRGLSFSSDIFKVRSIRSVIYNGYTVKEKDKEVFIETFHNIYKGRPILIMGNGPSAVKFNTNKFVKKYNPILFNCNFYFKGFKKKPHYWFCIDSTCLKEAIIDVPKDINIFINTPTQFIEMSNPRTFISNARHVINESFKFAPYEIERPYTVALLMTLLSLYMGGSPIFIIGVDLPTEKGANNYLYSEKFPEHNSKFRDFSNNFFHIRREFKLLKQEAEIRGIKIYNLDPKSENLDMFEVFSLI
jgi:hypothetical protein